MPRTRSRRAAEAGLPLAERSPPSSPTHRWPDLFELSEYDFEELCEELVGTLDGVSRAAPKNRRGNSQFGVDVEGYSSLQKPVVVLSAKRERGPTRAKIGRWSTDFLKHINGHWHGKGVERFILACADELRGDQINGQITADAATFASHSIAYEPWDCKHIVRLLRSRRDLVEIYLHPAWVERICGIGSAGPSPPLAGSGGQNSAAVAGAAPSISKLAAVAERLAESTRRELELAMAEARRWRPGALDAFLDRIRGDAVQWDALPDQDKARILRLGAARALGRDDSSGARRLAGDAAAFHEADDRTLQALILRSEDRTEAALDLLREPLNEAERNTRAALLIEVGRPSEALSLLGTAEPSAAAPEEAEALRLTMLAWLVQRRPKTALEFGGRARPSIVGEDAGVAWVEAVAHFNAALAHGAAPDVGGFPNPIDRSLIREDGPSLRHLDEAARRFAELAKGVDGSDREDLEVWQLAALSSDPAKSGEAEVLSRQLVSRANPHPGAVAWALARGYEVNSAKVRRSYRDLLAAGRGTASHLAVLAGLELSLGQPSRAQRLLEQEGHRFSSGNDRALIDFWVEQVRRVVAGEEARPPLPPALGENLADALAGNDDAAERLEHGLAECDADARTIAQVAESLARAGRHAAITKLAPRLLGHGTARGVSLVAHAAFFLGDWRRTSEILRDHMVVFVGARLPVALGRLQVEAAFRLGDAGAALAYAREAVVTVSGDGAEALRDLAVLHHQLGDVRGAAFQLRQLGNVESLPAREAILFARDIRRHDPELANRLLRHSARDLDDPGVVTEGMRLALDTRDDALARDVFGPAFRRLAESGGPNSIVRVVDTDQAAAALRDAAQSFETAWQLWLDAALPMHVAFGEQRPDVIAMLFDERRDLNKETIAPLLVRPGRPDERGEEADGTGNWSVALDLTALLLADALDLLDALTSASAEVRLPASVPESLRALEEAVRPVQPFLREAEAAVHAAIRDGRIATAPDDDCAERQVVREAGDPGTGPTFADMAATLRDRCGISAERIDPMLAEGGSAGDPRLLGPGAQLLVHVHRLVQLQAASLLEAAFQHFGIAVRPVEGEALGHAVGKHARAEARAERLARLRERVADHLSRRLWSLLPQTVDPNIEGPASAPECSLRELLAATARTEADDRLFSNAWVEDRFISGFSSVENRTTIVTAEEVLAYLWKSLVLTDDECDAARTRLRVLGYAFLPFRDEEILGALNSAPLSGGRLVETEGLAIIRRHLALQIEALAHAAVAPEFRRPDGRVDDSGIIAHIFGLWHRMLPKVWARFPADRDRRYAAADWILGNLRVEALAAGPLATRPAELLDSFRVKSCAWLVVQAAFISVSSVAEGPARWETWRTLIGEYVRFALARVIEPLAQMSDGSGDAIADALAEWAIAASDSLPDIPDEADDERARNVFQNIIRVVLAEMPLHWLNRMEAKPGFVDRFGAFVEHRVEIEPFTCSSGSFWPAVTRAFAEGETRVVTEEPGTDAVVRSRETESGRPYVVVQVAGTEVELRDPSVALAHPDEGVRRLMLARDADWLEGTSERRTQTISALVGEQDVLRRMTALQSEREKSLAWRLQKIGLDVRQQTTMDWSLLEPPPPANVRDHLRLDADRAETTLADAAQTAAARLMEELPVEFAGARLAGFVVPLPNELLRGMAHWLESAPGRTAERFESFSATPLRARLAARALLLHGSSPPDGEGGYLALVADALEDGASVFRAVLRWVVRVTARRSDWRDLDADERAVLSWVYADLLASTLLSADIDRAATAQTFEEREILSPRDLGWQSGRSASLAERAELLPSRALVGVVLGDVLAGMRADIHVDGETKRRFRELCSSPSGPYAAPELFPLGRPGWSWIDADPLPILSRFLDDFGPDNLTSLDRRGRAELVAREFADNIESDVAGLLLTVIGADALEGSSAADLLCRLRSSVSTETIIGQETLGSLHTEAALVEASAGEAGPTAARLKEAAQLLATRHRGVVLGLRTEEEHETPTDRHAHALIEIAWALSDSENSEEPDQRIVAFADLATSLVSCWPALRTPVATVLNSLSEARPMVLLQAIQPYLERIRRS